MALSSDPSAWRNLREPRKLTRPVGRPRKTEVRIPLMVNGGAGGS